METCYCADNPQWPANFDTKTFDASLFNLAQTQTQNNTLGNQTLPQLPNDNATPASLPSVQSVQSHGESSNSGYSPNTRKRRREGDGARRLVVASFSNETDALEILANAATDDKKDQYGGNDEQDRTSGRKVTFEDKVGARMEEFVLVKQRILDVARLELLIRVFFEHHHPALVSTVNVFLHSTVTNAYSLYFKLREYLVIALNWRYSVGPSLS